MAAALFQDNYLEEEKVADGGDLVEFDRGLYKHYGVAVDSKHMVHLTSADPGRSSSNFASGGPTAVVKKERISKVGKNYRILKKREQEEDCRDTKTIVRDAEAMVGRRMRYNLFKKNCEHVARDLVFGVPKCKQAKKVADGVKITCVVAAVLVAAFALIKICRF